MWVQLLLSGVLGEGIFWLYASFIFWTGLYTNEVLVFPVALIFDAATAVRAWTCQPPLDWSCAGIGFDGGPTQWVEWLAVISLPALFGFLVYGVYLLVKRRKKS